MTGVDLRSIVPEPPESLLSWSEIARGIRRRRLLRAVGAAGAVVVVIAGGAAAVGAIHGPSTTPAIPGPFSHQDGRLLFAKDTAGSTKYYRYSSLFSLAPFGGRIRRVTHQSGELIEEAAAAPDGKQIAYVQDTYGTKHSHRHVNGEDVHVADANGAHDRTVYRCPNSDCGNLVWSPTSDRLLITAEHSQMLEPDGRLTQVCIGGCPGDSIESASWSPNGKQVAFQWWKNVTLTSNQKAAAEAIGVMNADGSHPRLLTNRQCTGADRDLCTDDTDPQWSPNGSTIAFLRVPQAYLLPEGDIGGIPRQPAEIESIRSDGSHLQRLSTCGKNCSIQGLAWSPAGRQIAYMSNDLQPGTNKEVTNLELAAAGIGRESSERLEFLNSGMRSALVWAPSGTRIAIAGRLDVGPPSGTYVVRVTSRRLSSPDRVTTDGYPPLAWLAAPNN